MTTSFDSVKQAINTLTKLMGINETYLAGMLNVTEKSLNEWKKLGAGDLTPKALRLKRCFEVATYIQKNFSESIKTSEIKNVLENGRITLDPDDEDDGTTALISYILAHPDGIWVPVTKEAVENYLSLRPKMEGKPLEIRSEFVHKTV